MANQYTVYGSELSLFTRKSDVGTPPPTLLNLLNQSTNALSFCVE